MKHFYLTFYIFFSSGNSQEIVHSESDYVDAITNSEMET